jgi:hypothetical protein
MQQDPGLDQRLFGHQQDCHPGKDLVCKVGNRWGKTTRTSSECRDDDGRALVRVEFIARSPSHERQISSTNGFFEHGAHASIQVMIENQCATVTCDNAGGRCLVGDDRDCGRNSAHARGLN